MSNANDDWSDPVKKNTAVYKVLVYMRDHPDEAAQCVGNDDAARTFFKDHGGIEVPADPSIRVIIFGQGERAKQVGASVILEIPSGLNLNSTDEQLKPFVLGNYPYWPPRVNGR